MKEIRIKKIENENYNLYESKYYFVHRLDRETSGLILVAKNSLVAGLLQKQFQYEYLNNYNIDNNNDSKKVEKIYNVLVNGKFQNTFSKSIIARGYLTPDLKSVVHKKRAYISLYDVYKNYLRKNKINVIKKDIIQKKKMFENEVLSKKDFIDLKHNIQNLKTFLENEISNISIILKKENKTHTLFNNKLYFNKVEFCESEFELLKYNKIKNMSLLKVKLKTGRTHQIRATICSMGYYVIGDKIYGEDPNNYLKFIKGEKNTKKLIIDRSALHAISLKFIHPISFKKIELSIPLAKDISNLLI